MIRSLSTPKKEFIRSRSVASTILLLTAFLSSVALLLSTPPSIHQEIDRNERVWHKDDGLPSGRIQAIAQTADGYLWLGTSRGLSRFDGYHFSNFYRTNTHFLSVDNIVSLCPANDGSLWVGTDGGGLVQVQKNGQFRSLGAPQGLTNEFIRALHQDARGDLWVGTDHGLFRLRDNRLSRVDAGPMFPNISVRAFYEDHRGRLWVAGFGLFLYNGRTLQKRDLPGGTAANTVSALQESSDGIIWLGTEAGLRQLTIGDDGKPTVSLASRVYASSFLADQNRMWIGTTGAGLLEWTAGRLRSYKHRHTVPNPIVSALFKDRQNNIWVGTHTGLLRLGEKAALAVREERGPSDQNVSSVYQSSDGANWIIDITGRLWRQLGDRSQLVRLPIKNVDVRVRTVYQDRQGGIWIGTEGQGVIEMSHGHFKTYTAKNGLRSDFIRTFCEDQLGNIWIGTSSGISRWDGHRFRNYYLNDGLVYFSVTSLARDSNGDIWVGTSNGLSQIHRSEIVPNPRLGILRHKKILSIADGQNGELWLGTDGDGLIRVKRGQATVVHSRSNLPDTIFQVLGDGVGNLWLLTPVGVFRTTLDELDSVADGKSDAFTATSYETIGSIDLRPTMDEGTLAGCLTRQRELLFPNLRSLIHIRPSGTYNAISPPPLHIESVVGDNRPIPVGHAVHVPPGRGQLDIQYSAIDFEAPERLRFKYKLEGFDTSWTDSWSRRIAYYTNLPPGHYNFRVLSYDRSAPSKISQASLSITLEPHYYQSTWFYLTGMLSSMVLLWFSMRLYAQQTKSRFAILLAERTRMAREMHDTVVQGCVGVATLLDAVSVMPKEQSAVVADLIDRARAESKATLDQARQAIWELRDPSLFRDFGAAVTNLARQVTIGTGLEVETDVQATIGKFEERTAHNLFFVANEALRNAIKHSGAKHVQLRLCLASSEVCLEIRDDGCGFEPKLAFASFGHYGLLGMRERLQCLGGNLTLESRPGNGTTVKAIMPLSCARSL